MSNFQCEISVNEAQHSVSSVDRLVALSSCSGGHPSVTQHEKNATSLFILVIRCGLLLSVCITVACWRCREASEQHLQATQTSAQRGDSLAVVLMKVAV